MYRTPEGERTLEGALAALFREAVHEAVQWIVMSREDDPWEFGVEAFDALQRSQQIYLLHLVGHALLVATWPAPNLTAPVEAAVAVLMKAIEGGVEFEIDTPEYCGDWKSWRQMVLECMPPDPYLPAADCDEAEKWDAVLEALMMEVLWDEDWDDAALYADKPPELAGMLKQTMDIPDDYYTAIVPEPSVEEAEALLNDLEELTGSGFPK